MFGIGNICADVKELSFLPLSIKLEFTPSSLDGVPVNISKANGFTHFIDRKLEVDESFKNCTEILEEFYDGEWKVNGSLGFIIDHEVRRDDSIFLFNNYMLNVLKYDAFPCPQQAS